MKWEFQLFFYLIFKRLASRSLLIFTFILTCGYCQDQFIDVELVQMRNVMILSSFVTNEDLPLRVNITGNVNPNAVTIIQSPSGSKTNLRIDTKMTFITQFQILIITSKFFILQLLKPSLD